MDFCISIFFIIYNLFKDRDFLEVSLAMGTHEHKEYQKKQKNELKQFMFVTKSEFKDKTLKSFLLGSKL